MPILDPCFMSKIDALTAPLFFTTFCLILKFQNLVFPKRLYNYFSSFPFNLRISSHQFSESVLFHIGHLSASCGCLNRRYFQSPDSNSSHLSHLSANWGCDFKRSRQFHLSKASHLLHLLANCGWNLKRSTQSKESNSFQHLHSCARSGFIAKSPAQPCEYPFALLIKWGWVFNRCRRYSYEYRNYSDFKNRRCG